MVDPVNNRGYQEYNRINVKVGTNVENGEKFSLNYGQEEDESGKKEDGKTKVETDGVIAEFSSQTQTRYGGAGNGKTGTAQTEEYIDFGAAAERARGFIGELVKAFSGFISSIKKALLDFWNSDSSVSEGNAKDALSGAEDGEKGENIIDVTDRSQAIDGESVLSTVEAEGVAERAPSMEFQIAKPEDRKAQAKQYLENEELMRRYVKNSDLLTYYDRSGKLVQLNGADKNRILHGDKRTSRGV